MDAKQLVAGMAAGDEEAWRAFLETHGRLIYAVAGRFAARGIDREDLFQETCLKAFQSIHTLQSPDRLASWVYTITYRLGVDALRHERPSMSVGNPEGLGEALDKAGEVAGPLEDLERLEAVAGLMDALGLLESRCQRLLRALYLEEPSPSYAEIGQREDMPIGSIGPTRARCLEKLKSALKRLSNAPPDPSA